jgi:hypothetical protein
LRRPTAQPDSLAGQAIRRADFPSPRLAPECRRVRRARRTSPSRKERGMSVNTIIYIVGLIVVIGFVLNLLGVY